MKVYWLWVWLGFWSFVVIPFGGFLTTDNWHNWAFVGRLPHWLGTIVGLLLVGLGTLFATKIWNDISTAEQRLNMLKAVAAETMVSLSVARSIVGEKRTDEEVRKFRVYTQIPTGTLEAAMSSGLFVDDPDAMAALRNLHALYCDINCRSQVVQPLIAIGDEDRRAEIRRGFEMNADIAPRLVECVTALKEMVIARGVEYEYSPYGPKTD
jgi:hypothetical protein